MRRKYPIYFRLAAPWMMNNTSFFAIEPLKSRREEKVEDMAEMIVALLIMVVAFGIVVQSIFSRKPVDPEDAAVVAVLLGLNDGSHEHKF